MLLSNLPGSFGNPSLGEAHYQELWRVKSPLQGQVILSIYANFRALSEIGLTPNIAAVSQGTHKLMPKRSGGEGSVGTATKNIVSQIVQILWLK